MPVSPDASEPLRLADARPVRRRRAGGSYRPARGQASAGVPRGFLVRSRRKAFSKRKLREGGVRKMDSGWLSVLGASRQIRRLLLRAEAVPYPILHPRD